MNSNSGRLQQRMLSSSELTGGALKSLPKKVLPHFRLIRKNYLLTIDKTILKPNKFKIQIFGSKQQESLNQNIV